MAPGGPGNKRKRGGGFDDGARPSPYRPNSSGMAQHSYGGPPHSGYYEDRGRGSRRGGRGGRGGRGPPRAPESPNGTAYSQRRESHNQQQTSRPQSQQSQTHPEPAVPREQSATPQAPPEPPQPAVPVDAYAVAAAMKFPPIDPSPRPYTYDHITDDIAKSWKDTGRASLLEKAASLKKDNNDTELNIVYGELLRAGLDGKVPPADVGAFVKDVLATEVEHEEMDQGGYIPDAVSDFLDLVSVLNEKDCENPRLAAILFASEISHEKMRQELDSEVLVQLSLVRNIFKKSFIRHQTNVLYRQSNYNLLREETEGYSKLMTELFTTSANEPPSAENVKATFERVRSMIGTFDLDVGRVLDVSLDVFAAVLVRQYRFFVKFLRCSSWWPSEAKNNARAPELPHWASPDANGFEPLSEEESSALTQSRLARDSRFWEYARQLAAKGKGLDAFFHLRNLQTTFPADKSAGDAEDDPTGWKEATGTEPPVGSKVAAQILGFKLRFYSSPARDPTDELPNNLVHLAALLIKIGFISLQDLYPHLWPHDDDMEKVRKQKEEEAAQRKQAARPGGGQNALTRAGALADDTIPPPLRSRAQDTKTATTTETTADATGKKPEDELPEPKDTKIALLKALLAIGAIPEAMFILGRFPWLLKLIHDLPDYIHRLLNHSISRLYEPLKPLQSILELQEPAVVADPDQSGVGRGELRRMKQPALKSLRWANLDREMTDEGVQYRFYWEDWHDNMPVCQSVDDLFTLCDSFLCLFGVRIGQDSSLLTKFYRIGINSLEVDKTDANKQRWIDLSKKLLVPALSLTGHNSPVVNECWELLKRFSQKTRYSIYAEWNLGPTSRLDGVADANAITRAKTTDILKKISKTNIRPMARALAKVATNSPGIVFDNAIRQMESYSNLVEVVVECARYFTALGYDVLTWSTLHSLGRERNRQSEDGMFASKWLSALASFFGKVYWRYSMMNLSPTLQYLAHQLYRGNAADLKVFEELLLHMGGIRSDITLNDAQIVAMAGGPLLQKEVLLSLQDSRYSSRPTARRLMRALIDTNLVGPFVISIAQERQTQLYKLGTDGAPLKLLGNAFDDMHQTLTQYLAFLREFLPSDDFDRFVPALGQLIGEFGLEPRIAFWICRTSIANKMEDFDKAETDNKKLPQPQVSEATDVEMADKVSGDSDTAMVDATPNAAQTPSVDAPEASPGWHPVLTELMDQTRDSLDSDELKVVGELFYMTFWQLSQGDLYVPQDSYEAEYTRILQKQRAISADRSDNTLAGTRKREAARAALNAVRDQLQAEHKEQVKTHRGFTQNRIAKEKEHWFAHTSGQYDALNAALLEQCFIPRILLSQLDAYYCFRMLKMLHSEGAKNFRTMGFLDQFFNQKRLAVLFFMCTLKEAENLAVFINEVLKHLGRWHAKKETYESEALGSRRDLPGFCKKIGDDKASYVFLNYEDEFKRLLFKWHGQLANAIRQCLEGGEYMHIRNAITILRGFVAVFPVVDTQGKKLLEVVTNLGKTETREDLKLAAQSLLGALARRERNREWVSLATFYPAKNAGGTTPGAANSASPADGKNLNAEAPEFKPARVNGAKAIAEHEDGEINSPTVPEAPKDRKSDQPASAAAHTTLSAVTATGKAAAPDDTSRSEGISRSGPPRSDGRGEGRPSPAPGSRAETSGRLTNGAPRASHTLPARPEGPPPPGRRGERGYPREDRSYNRDGRLPREEREAGYPDQSRAARGPERSRMPDRSHERGSERPPPAKRERPDLMRRGDVPPPRHQPSNERETRQSRSERPERSDRPERGTRDGRDHARETQREEPSRGGPSPEANMPPPAPVVNPERARLIQEDQAAASKDRHPRDVSRSGSQRNSRANSPSRRDDRSHRGPHHDESRQFSHDSRPERSHPEERRPGPRESFDGHDDRSRHPRSGPPPAEPHGSRHSRDHGPPPGESQYGRLNGPDAPTGPRGGVIVAPGRPARMPAGPAASPTSNSERSGDRPTPSGPASSRAPPRLNSVSQGRAGSGSAPSTPIAESPATGVHPERARQIQDNGPAPPTVNSPSTAPRGPAVGAPTGPHRSTPSGPQSGPSTPSFERPRGDKRFANVNTTLQQNSGPPGRPEQGATIRGRGGRNMPQSPLGPGPTPAGAPSGPGRHDSGPRGDGMGPPRADLFAGQEGPGRRGGPDTGDRRPRGSGRSPSPTRRGPPPQLPTGTPENMRPPRRMESNESMRSSRHAPPAPGPPGPMPDRDRRAPRDPYGSAHGGARHGGGERRDVRDVSWGGERPGDRRSDAPTAPEGPGSGRKRRNEHDDYSSGDPKRHRRSSHR